ncbi:ribosomal-protein-alanine N-acetyltransferase [Pedobacter sp. CAN_A7]
MKLLQYNNFPNISGDRISLRQLVLADIQDIIEISYYDAIQAKTVQEATAMQAQINMDYKNGDSIHWGIIDNKTNKIVGTCGYYRGFDKGAGELGCILLPQYQGQGYMSAAMLLAIQFGLNTIGLKRIWAVTTRQNSAAIKLLERLNFTKIADLDEDEIEYELKCLKSNSRTI